MASLWRSRALRPYLSAEPILGSVVGSGFWPPEAASLDIAVRQTYKTVNSRIQRGVTVLAGDSILVGFYQDGALVSCSISDDAAGGSNTYEEIGEGIYVTGGSGCGIRTFKATAKASETLTITETGGSGYPIIFVHVVEGPTEVGGVVTKADTVASLAHTSGELTTSAQDAYLFCFWGEAGGAYTMAENGAGFRKREDDHGTATHDRIVSGPGTYQDVVTSSGSVYFASILLALVMASAGTTLNCPAPSALTLTGLAPTLSTRLACPAPATLTLSGTTPSLSVGVTLACPAPSSLTLTGHAPTLLRTLAVPSAASLALTGQAPTLGVRLAVPAPPILALQGLAPTLRTSLGCPAPAALTLSGLAPTLQAASSSTLQCPAPSVLTLVGQTPSLRLALAPAPGSLTLTGQAPSISIRLAVPAATLSLAGNAPSLNRRLLTPAPAALNLATFTPSLRTTLAVPPTSLTLDTPAPTLAITLVPPVAVMTLQSFAPSLSLQGPLSIDPRYFSDLGPVSHHSDLAPVSHHSDLRPASHHSELGPVSYHSDLSPAVYEVTL